jgi:diphthamide biosynthesis protein 2
MTAFSSNEEAVLQRSIAPSAASPFDLEVESTARFIHSRGHKRIALQFPDGLLHHASAAVAGLNSALRAQANDARGVAALFVLGDTSFDGFQVDFISAQHLSADLIVHYGPVDLEAEGPLPVRFVLGRRPLDVQALARSIRASIPTATGGGGGGGGSGEGEGGDSSCERRLLVVPSLPYMHLSEGLRQALSAASCHNALVCSAEIERSAVDEHAAGRAATEAKSTAEGAAVLGASAKPSAAGAAASAASAALARGRLLGRQLPLELSEAALAQLDLLYIGPDDQTLSNLVMLLRDASVYRADPEDGPEGGAEGGAAGGGPAAKVADPLAIAQLSLQTSRRLMRRYYLTQCAREAEVVGILIGTLSASQRGPMLASLKALIREAGRKYYVFVMGKLNAAKLANFMEVGVYVLLGSSEHALLDSKDFYRPVVTPYELHLSLAPGAEWTGEYVLDYGRLLPRLVAATATSEEAASVQGGGSSGGARSGQGGEGGEGEDEDEDEEPVFSLLSGRLLPRRRATEPSVEGGASRERASQEGEDGGGGSTALSAASSALTTRQGDYAVARSGAEHLSRRSYRGLEPRLGEHAPSTVVEGLSGIASSFEGEGTPYGQGRFAAAGLLETRSTMRQPTEAPPGTGSAEPYSAHTRGHAAVVATPSYGHGSYHGHVSQLEAGAAESRAASQPSSTPAARTQTPGRVREGSPRADELVTLRIQARPGGRDVAIRIRTA